MKQDGLTYSLYAVFKELSSLKIQWVVDLERVHDQCVRKCRILLQDSVTQ